MALLAPRDLLSLPSVHVNVSVHACSPSVLFLFFLFTLQRELQISLLRNTCETRLAAQPAPRRHAVHGTPTAARSAETEVRGRLGAHVQYTQYSLGSCSFFFLHLHILPLLQVQAGAEVRWLHWRELLKWRPASSWCRGADRHCTESTPPAVPRSAAFFLFLVLSQCLVVYLECLA